MYAVGGMDSNKGWSTVDENYQGFIVTQLFLKIGLLSLLLHFAKF